MLNLFQTYIRMHLRENILAFNEFESSQHSRNVRSSRAPECKNMIRFTRHSHRRNQFLDFLMITKFILFQINTVRPVFLFRLGYVYQVSNQRPFHRHHRLVQIGFRGTAALFQTSQRPDFRLSAFRKSNSKYFI